MIIYNTASLDGRNGGYYSYDLMQDQDEYVIVFDTASVTGCHERKLASGLYVSTHHISLTTGYTCQSFLGPQHSFGLRQYLIPALSFFICIQFFGVLLSVRCAYFRPSPSRSHFHPAPPHKPVVFHLPVSLDSHHQVMFFLSGIPKIHSITLTSLWAAKQYLSC